MWGVLLLIQFCYFIMRNYIGDLSDNIVEVESIKEPSVNSNEMMVLEKEGQLEGVNESSEIILGKEEQSELKVYDMDFLMNENGETKENFFGGAGEREGISISKKKKKKKKRVLGGTKKNNTSLIPDD